MYLRIDHILLAANISPLLISYLFFVAELRDPRAEPNHANPAKSNIN